MLIQNPGELANAIRPFMKDQMVVRYAVSRLGPITYDAEIALLDSRKGGEYLDRMIVSVRLARGNFSVHSNFIVTSLAEEPNAIVEMCSQWKASRRFDDWLHGDIFMGAYEVFRDRQPCTSLKLEVTDARWRLLTGVVLTTLSTYQPDDRDGDAAVDGLSIMQRRFCSLAEQLEELRLTAR